MKRVLISVEGQTEETFVREVLYKHLLLRNVFVQPVIVSTKRAKQGNKFKGGLLSYEQARNEVRHLCENKAAFAVTTLYDLYHLPVDFPGYATRPAGNGRAKAVYLEQAFQQDINIPSFRPHLQVHEFEAFMFVDPKKTAALFPENDLTRELREIRESFQSPEDINDSPITAPSKRILALYPKYDKPLYGTLAVLEIGLDKLRAECPHFHTWLDWLESLG